MTRLTLLRLLPVGITVSAATGATWNTRQTFFLSSPQAGRALQDVKRTSGGFWFLELHRDILSGGVASTRQFLGQADSTGAVKWRSELPSEPLALSLNVLPSGNLVLSGINGELTITDQRGNAIRKLQNSVGGPFAGQTAETLLRHSKSGVLEAHSLQGSKIERKSISGVLPGAETVLVQSLRTEIVAVVDRLTPRAALVNLATGGSRLIKIQSPELSLLQDHYTSIVKSAPANYVLRPVLFTAIGVDRSGRLALLLARTGTSPTPMLHVGDDGVAIDHTNCVFPPRSTPGFQAPSWMFWDKSSFFVVFGSGGCAVL
jgi:hypothetical protein